MAIKIFGGNNLLVECINSITDKWMVLWNEQNEGDSTSYQAEIFTHKPTITEIKDTILDWYNKKIDQEILSGFVWNNLPVWLSMENQFNYKAAYDIAAQSGGEILPTFKFGTTENPVYYKFESFEDLKDFYLKAVAYVTDTLATGWQEKDRIDWTVYEDLLK